MKFALSVNGHPGPDPAEFDRLTPDTQEMVRWIDAHMLAAYCQEAVITDMIRPGVDTSHGHGRAVDIRTRSLTQTQARELETAIRSRFGRTYRCPITGRLLWRAWYHDSGGGWHLHVASPT